MSDPQWLEVPAGTRARECRGCQATIYWIEHPTTGRPHPVDCDVDGGQEPDPEPQGEPGLGISHFATCPEAASFRRRR